MKITYTNMSLDSFIKFELDKSPMRFDCLVKSCWYEPEVKTSEPDADLMKMCNQGRAAINRLKLIEKRATDLIDELNQPIDYTSSIEYYLIKLKEAVENK